MGLTLGISFSTDTDKNGIVKCVPEHRYNKIRLSTQHEKLPGQLVNEFKALQKNYHFKPEPENAYWWCSAKFLPNDDTKIVVTAGAFTPRSNHAWMTYKHVPNGRIMVIQILENKLSGYVFYDTRMANYPRVDLHPSGKFIGYLGLEGVKIVTTQEQDVYCKLKDMRCCNYRCCAFSPNGGKLAMVLSANHMFELMVSKVGKTSSYDDITVNLGRLFPNFKFTRMYNEHIECKWSPDSELIAVCTNTFCLVVLNKNLEVVADVVEEILPEDRFPCWSGTFDFDPCSRSDLMAVGANHGQVFVVSLRSKSVILETEPFTKEAIDYVKYNHQGTLIAVATRDMCIYLLDSVTGHITFEIDMIAQCGDLGERLASFPAIMNIDFSAKGDYLVTGSCDGKVRLWKLKTDFSLFSLCKWAVLSATPSSKVKELQLPDQIKDKLLSFPAYE